MSQLNFEDRKSKRNTTRADFAATQARSRCDALGQRVNEQRQLDSTWPSTTSHFSTTKTSLSELLVKCTNSRNGCIQMHCTSANHNDSAPPRHTSDQQMFNHFNTDTKHIREKCAKGWRQHTCESLQWLRHIVKNRKLRSLHTQRVLVRHLLSFFRLPLSPPTVPFFSVNPFRLSFSLLFWFFLCSLSRTPLRHEGVRWYAFIISHSSNASSFLSR